MLAVLLMDEYDRNRSIRPSRPDARLHRRLGLRLLALGRHRVNGTIGSLSARREQRSSHLTHANQTVEEIRFKQRDGDAKRLHPNTDRQRPDTFA